MIYMKGKHYLVVLFLLATLLVSLYGVSALTPNGATVSKVRSETASSTSPTNDSAVAGNITELLITGYSTTQSWQGYIGNVSGAIRLADASGDVLYNWSLANPSGEVYASTNSTITWTNIQCFNYTARGNQTNITTGETAGATNLFGINLTTLQTLYGIDPTDADAVNNTFTDANSHAQFFTANQQFSAGECVSSDIFDTTGASVDGNFEEVILYEPATASVVFTALLESNVAGYDVNAHDFEMLVLEDGHDGNVATTSYYFFVELE